MRTPENLGQEIAEYLLLRGLKLQVAESCTGGTVAHLLTKIPGASKWFHSSLVTYMPEAKNRYLGLHIDLSDPDPDLTTQEVAKEMSHGLSSDPEVVTLSTTGVAGPGPSHGHAAGTMWCACRIGEYTYTEKIVLDTAKYSNREEIILELSHRAIAFLWEKMSENDCIR